MDATTEFTETQKAFIKSVVHEALDERLRDLPTRADLEELAKDSDIGAIVRILEHHGLIIKADETESGRED